MRDYDKEPIILEDHNASFAYYSMKYVGFPLMLVVFFIYPLISGSHIKSSFASIGATLAPIYMLFKQSKLRKIVLKQHRIEYIDSGEPLAIIDLNESNRFQKSFQNYYYKKQNLHFLYLLFIFFFVALLMKSLINSAILLVGAFITVFLMAQITKYILSDHGFVFFTSIVVQQDEDIISIPIYKKNDYQDINDYLQSRGIDIRTLPTFFKPFYGTERTAIFGSLFPKDIVCPKCRRSLHDSIFSCSNCGNPLTDEKMEESIAENKYFLRTILRDKKDFVKIKELLRKQYEAMGYRVSSVDREDMLMLKSESKLQSYISIKHKAYNFYVDGYNIEQPTLKVDAQEYFVNT